MGSPLHLKRILGLPRFAHSFKLHGPLYTDLPKQLIALRIPWTIISVLGYFNLNLLLLPCVRSRTIWYTARIPQVHDRFLCL